MDLTLISSSVTPVVLLAFTVVLRHHTGAKAVIAGADIPLVLAGILLATLVSGAAGVAVQLTNEVSAEFVVLAVPLSLWDLFVWAFALGIEKRIDEVAGTDRPYPWVRLSIGWALIAATFAVHAILLAEMVK